MCELFGVSASPRVRVNDYLKEFFSHSVNHPHGWGLAVFYGNAVSLEKEPIMAASSKYLRERLRQKIETNAMIAHIRFATKGVEEYANTHPFVKHDNFGRTWTLAHNGTIFSCPKLQVYVQRQEGSTDSERILYYLLDRVNARQTELSRPLDEEERFDLLEEIVSELSEGNKLNLLIYDSEVLYAHSNFANTLYFLEKGGAFYFATVPLDKGDWKPVPFTALCSYKGGRSLRTGTPHGKEYIYNENDMKLIFIDYASL